MKKYSLLFASFWISGMLSAQQDHKLITKPTLCLNASGIALRDGNKSLINYHDAMSFDGQYDYEQIDLKNITNLTLFAIYSTKSGTSTVAKIENSALPFEIKNSSVVHRQAIDFMDTHQNPKILMTKDRLLKSKKSKYLNFGDLTKENGNFNGQLAEVLVYDRHLNDREIKTIETSLALKYGIPFSDTSKYYDGRYECLFDAKANQPFSYHVAAIGYDQATWFDQKQSKSVYSEIDLTISHESISKKNESYDKLKNIDNLYIILADNNAETSFRPSKNKLNLSEMDRKWKLQVVGYPKEAFSELKDLYITIKPESILNFDRQKETYMSYQENGKTKYRKFTLDDCGYFVTKIPGEEINQTLIFSFIQIQRDQPFIYYTNYDCEKQMGSLSVEVLDDKYESYVLKQNEKEMIFFNHNIDLKAEGLKSGNYSLEATNLSLQKKSYPIIINALDCHDNISMFPNPSIVDQKVNIISKDNVLSKLEIFNADKLLVEKYNQIFKNSFEVTILKPGAYTLNITDIQGKIITKTLIVVE